MVTTSSPSNNKAPHQQHYGVFIQAGTMISIFQYKANDVKKKKILYYILMKSQINNRCFNPIFKLKVAVIYLY